MGSLHALRPHEMRAAGVHGETLGKCDCGGTVVVIDTDGQRASTACDACGAEGNVPAGVAANESAIDTCRRARKALGLSKREWSFLRQIILAAEGR